MPPCFASGPSGGSRSLQAGRPAGTMSGAVLCCAVLCCAVPCFLPSVQPVVVPCRQHNSSSPCTGEELGHSQLLPNTALKQAMAAALEFAGWEAGSKPLGAAGSLNEHTGSGREHPRGMQGDEVGDDK